MDCNTILSCLSTGGIKMKSTNKISANHIKAKYHSIQSTLFCYKVLGLTALGHGIQVFRS